MQNLVKALELRTGESLLKAKYTKRWKGKDGKWRYEYTRPGSGSKRQYTHQPETISERESDKRFAEETWGPTKEGKSYSVEQIKKMKRSELIDGLKTWGYKKADFEVFSKKEIADYLAVESGHDPIYEEDE